MFVRPSALTPSLAAFSCNFTPTAALISVLSCSAVLPSVEIPNFAAAAFKRSVRLSAPAAFRSVLISLFVFPSVAMPKACAFSSRSCFKG
ncbi:hypothetical protein D3C86_1987190 [compost metagenome]